MKQSGISITELLGVLWQLPDGTRISLMLNPGIFLYRLAWGSVRTNALKKNSPRASYRNASQCLPRSTMLRWSQQGLIPSRSRWRSRFTTGSWWRRATHRRPWNEPPAVPGHGCLAVVEFGLWVFGAYC